MKTRDIKRYSFADDAISHEEHRKKELDSYIEEFGICYSRREDANLHSDTCIRLFFLLRELREARDALHAKDGGKD